MGERRDLGTSADIFASRHPSRYAFGDRIRVIKGRMEWNGFYCVMVIVGGNYLQVHVEFGATCRMTCGFLNSRFSRATGSFDV